MNSRRLTRACPAPPPATQPHLVTRNSRRSCSASCPRRSIVSAQTRALIGAGTASYCNMRCWPNDVRYVTGKAQVSTTFLLYPGEFNRSAQHLLILLDGGITYGNHGHSWKQKPNYWGRWKNGQSVLAISRGLERRNKTGVQRSWLSMEVWRRRHVAELLRR